MEGRYQSSQGMVTTEGVGAAQDRTLYDNMFLFLNESLNKSLKNSQKQEQINKEFLIDFKKSQGTFVVALKDRISQAEILYTGYR